MTYICYRGIEVSVRLQYALLGIEVATLVAFAFFALVKVYAGDAPGSIKPSLDWLSPSGLSTTAIVSATLIAVFIYWGWDTAVATNEESDDPATTPGRAAVISTLLLLATYALVSVATIAFAGVGDSGIGLGNVDNADDVFAAMGHEVFGGGAVGWIMVNLLAICVLTSASASTQTTILPTARTSLSMAAFKAIPGRFARIHPKYLTPERLDHLDGRRLDRVLRRSDPGQREHPGRHHRRGRADDRLLLRAHRLRVRVVLPQDHVGQAARRPDAGRAAAVRRPAAAGLLRDRLQDLRDPDYGYTSIGDVGGVFLIGVGSLLLGVVLMFVYQGIAPAYFRGETLPKRHSGDLVLVGGGDKPVGVRLPDSREQTVIAPDLSNLPPGQEAVDPVTGERITKDPDDEDQAPRLTVGCSLRRATTR